MEWQPQPEDQVLNSTPVDHPFYGIPDHAFGFGSGLGPIPELSGETQAEIEAEEERGRRSPSPSDSEKKNQKAFEAWRRAYRARSPPRSITPSPSPVRRDRGEERAPSPERGRQGRYGPSRDQSRRPSPARSVARSEVEEAAKGAKPSVPSKWDGQKKDVKPFLNRYKLYFRDPWNVNMAWRAKIDKVMASLDANQSVKDWVQDYMNENIQFNSYEEFEAEFTKEFGNPFVQSEAQTKFLNLFQKENQSVGDYNRYFNEIRNQAGHRDNDQFVLIRYKMSILKKYKDEVDGWENAPETLEQWKRAVLTVEDRSKRKEAEKRFEGRYNSKSDGKKESTRAVSTKGKNKETSAQVNAVASGSGSGSGGYKPKEDYFKKALEAFQKDTKNDKLWGNLFNEYKKGRCFRCGSKDHSIKECKLADTLECPVCEKKGPNRYMCWKGQRKYFSEKAGVRGVRKDDEEPNLGKD